MHSSAWIVLLRRIPPDQHDILALVTTNGIEINIQTILRTEEDYVLIRGRLAGTTDTGRVFFVPYDQINYLGFVREVKETQIRAIYGEAPPAEPVEPKSDTCSTEPALAEPASAAATPDPAPPPAPEAKPPPEPPKPAAQFKIPRKSGVLERLRARAQITRNAGPPSNP
jgi:hypothetical protein